MPSRRGIRGGARLAAVAPAPSPQELSPTPPRGPSGPGETSTAPEATGGPPPPGSETRRDDIIIRAARTPDVRAMRALVAPFAEQRVLLQKEAVAYYESVRDFVIAERAGTIVGCGGLHVLWEDLAEIRTLAVSQDHLGQGVGGLILESLVTLAQGLGVRRLFCLTFEVDFFTRHGFSPIEGQAVTAEVYAELLRSYDEGVAEFLDLERVKPNTLGNTRMLRIL
ncbi:MAG: amino-acid N-acetyltransferase [Phycicoccus sp.]|nr:amino-acid N-acetyltransferase [Phycicoccus sp.]